MLDHPARTRDEAILACGEKLVELGAVAEGYVDEMLAREQKYSTYLGKGAAIPHGLFEAKHLINFDQIVFMRLRNEVEWGDEKVRIVIGLAVTGHSHVELLAAIADLLINSDKRQFLLECVDSQQALKILVSVLPSSAHK